MFKEPLTSVIIPFYNRIDWVTESIYSVLNQTYTNFEIILIDDGSNSENKIPEEIVSNPKIRIITQTNKGPSSARNKGIQNANGKYIAFLDSDDLFFPKKLEKQIEFMENNPDIYLSYTSYQNTDEKGNLQKIVKSGAGSANTYPGIILNCLIATPTVIVRKEIFQNGYAFDESIKIGEDVILWSSIAKSYKVAGINEPLTFVRRHEQSNAFDKNAQFIGQNNILNYFLEKETKNNYIKSKLLSGKAWNMYDYGFYKEALSFSLRSILKNPFNIRGWSCLVALVLVKIKLGTVVSKSKLYKKNYLEKSKFS